MLTSCVLYIEQIRFSICCHYSSSSKICGQSATALLIGCVKNLACGAVCNCQRLFLYCTPTLIVIMSKWNSLRVGAGRISIIQTRCHLVAKAHVPYVACFCDPARFEVRYSLFLGWFDVFVRPLNIFFCGNIAIVDG